MLVCSLTNTPTLNPVISLKSNRVFDGKALESYVTQHNSDPINNEQMTTSDIIPISNAQSHIPSSEEISNPTYSSIPTMLSAFQSAWDSLSIELFHIRSELDKTKKELSLALYRQDAAVKVAVGACKERDEARHALAQLIANGDASNVGITPTQLETIPTSVEWEDIVGKLRGEQERLLALHKLENKERKGNSPLHELDATNMKLVIDKKSGVARKNPSILKVDISAAFNEGIFVHKSGLVELIDLSGTKLKAVSKIPTTNPHTFWMQNEPYVITNNNQTKLINIRDKSEITVQTDIEVINNVASHPTLPLFIISGNNEFEVFFNNNSVFMQELNNQIENIKFHPDGLLIGVSYNGTHGIDIYDLSERVSKLNIECESHVDFVFAANGYSLFISTLEKVLLFDMRKNAITLETTLSSPSDAHLFVDIYTTLVASGNNFFVLDKKGKTIQATSTFDIEANGKLLCLLNTGDSFIVFNDTGIYKSQFSN